MPTYPSGVTGGSGVVLTDAMYAFLAKLRQAVPASIALYVTSGWRTPTGQVNAMWPKVLRYDAARAAGQTPRWDDDLTQLYRSNKDIALELLNSGRDKATWVKIIDKYAKAGRVLSPHQRADGLDLRNRDWTAEQAATVKSAIKSLGADYVSESDHLHVQRFTGLVGAVLAAGSALYSASAQAATDTAQSALTFAQPTLGFTRGLGLPAWSWWLIAAAAAVSSLWAISRVRAAKRYPAGQWG